MDSSEKEVNELATEVKSENQEFALKYLREVNPFPKKCPNCNSIRLVKNEQCFEVAGKFYSRGFKCKKCDLIHLED